LAVERREKMRRIALIAVGCLLLIVMGAPSRAPGDDAIALISSLAGKVDVQRAHPKGVRAARLGEQLFEGDVLSTYENSRASLFFSDGTVITVYPRSRLALSLREKGGSSLVTSLPKELLRGIGGIFSVERKRETLTAIPGIRKKIEEEEMGVRVLYPRNSMILTTKPRFRWKTRGEGRLFMVSLTLKGMGGQLWTIHTKGAQIPYPKGQRGLERGQTYFLKVESTEDPTLSDEVYFRVLDDQKAEEVRRVTRQMEELQKKNPDDSTARFILATFYKKKGLYHRALGELDALERENPRERFALQEKREIFAKMGFWRKWEAVNQKLNAL
jgi:hypothetical protein